MLKILLPFLAILIAPTLADAAPLALASVFGDSMVLQRAVPVPVWGTASPAATVSIEFAGQRKSAVADAKGNWMATLQSLATATEPQELTVNSGGETLVIRDVLVGEVWVAAGQSNMEFAMENEAHAKEELPKADYPQVRLLNLAHAGQYYSRKAFGPDLLKRMNPEEFYRGTWQTCTPQSTKPFSAIGYYFAKEVHQTLRVPIGVIHLAVGGSPTEAWIRREALAGDKELVLILKGNWLENDSQDAWCRQRGRENLGAGLKNMPSDVAGPNHPFKPGFLLEAGIARLIPFPIKGVLWYQGESNSLSLDRVRQHERLFPLLVSDWRKQWNLGEFPFLYCQLSSIGTEKGYKSQHWPEFRDSQRRMLSEIPNTGMAVTSDLGHPSDVHPRNKKDIGHRLALWALAQSYDKKVANSGPLAKSIQLQESTLVVSFDHAKGGFKTSDGKSPAGFEIAGDDGVFRPAEVKIGKDTLALTNTQVPEPVSARYAWQPFSIGNLTNGANLPASTFLLHLPRK